LLEGKNVDLRIVEKEDLPLLQEWWNSLEFSGIYNPIDEQRSKTGIEKQYEKLGSEKAWFLTLKKDGSKIGFLAMGTGVFGWQIGYVLIPSERGKGYCTEAVQLAVDYLFLSKDIVRVQAETFTDNIASQRVLEKSGFQREGTIRKGMLAWGKWVDLYIYSILREEWKEPKILTKTTQM
jgi:RimJ/RimL family protein N-acetyltransferase